MRSLLQTVVLCAENFVHLVVLVLVLFPRPLMADPVPAGTLIRNIAEITYFNAALGIIETIRSNPVEAEVGSVPALDVAGGSELLLTRGAMAEYHFEVTNTGNVPLETLLEVRDLAGSGLLADGSLVHDLNRNGVVDASDPAIGPDTFVTMVPGETLRLIYAFRVSAAATAGVNMRSVLVANARAVTGQGNLQLTGQASGLSRIVSGTLTLEKQQMLRRDGDTTYLRYDLRLRNNSDVSIAAYDNLDGAPLRVNGLSVSGVLLRDPLPGEVTFHTLDAAGGLRVLYHLAGEAPQDYTDQLPARLADVDAIAFLHEGAFPVGRSSDVAFTVRLPDNDAALIIRNTAETYLAQEGTTLTLSSNTTLHERDGTIPGELQYVNSTTGEEEETNAPGFDTRLRLSFDRCDVTEQVDSAMITILGNLTGDIERVTAVETGPTTGVFLTPAVPLARMDRAAEGDNVVATDNGDMLYAESVCDGLRVDDQLFITPGNFVFNALTNQAVEGGAVALMDATTGREIDRRVTDERGFFSFEDVAPGTYRYDVVGSDAWNFPTVRGDFAGYGRRVADAGFGQPFRHGGGAIFVSDIPVDPHYGAALSLAKTADREQVGHGEFVTYTLTLTNNMNQALMAAELLDRPPFGARLVPGSVALDAQGMPDPIRDGSGDLVFQLDRLAPLAQHELRYVMQYTAAAREGRNENTAILSGRQAGTGTLRQSQTARSVLRLDNSGGVFSRQGGVIGSVFMDCDADGIRGPQDEPGIPGIRIVTQEGLSVVTDKDGKYSLYGLRPVTHAFLLQEETLPRGTEVTVTRTNDLGRGGSRLVPLRRGELRAEHFAVTACTPAAMAEVAARQVQMVAQDGPDSLTAADLPIEARRAPQRSARNEAGIATTRQMTPDMFAETLDDTPPAAEGTPGDNAADAETRAEGLTRKAREAQRRQPLEALVRGMDTTPGFVDLADGETVMRRSQNIRVKGKADLTLSLLVNGRALDADRIGERTSWEAGNLQALDFVAVKLDAGTNRLTLVGRDGFGIERLRHEIRVIAPGQPARFDIILPETASANPASIVPVVVRALDARGLPVPASGTVTLDATRALWDVVDIRPGTPGIQAYLDNGEATFDLIPPQTSGPDLITVTGTMGESEAAITFTPDLDERILIGVIEGAVALGGSGDALLEQGRFSSFEDTTTGLRGELYLKGVIRGEALLTLRYSSDRDTEDRLFRDIQGDEYYPVYGDTSERGADAQSSGNLYVKVEKGRSHILYGDIAIEPESSAFRLGGLRRVATGAKAHWENDRVSVTLFGARTAQEQASTEFAGRGISGPYDLDLGGYVQGTERVELLVRDEDGGDILETRALRRGTDYLLDYFRNTITFDAPVRQFDAEGNPVSIRITYEVEGADADRYWLYGGEVNQALGDRTRIGLRAVHADAPRDNPARERLQSAYIRHDRGTGGAWEAEVARSENAAGVVDTAGRLSYHLKTETRRFSVEAIHSGRNFSARGGLARAGTSQLRLRYGQEINRRDELTFAAEFTRDRINASERLSVEADYTRQFSNRLRGSLGLEYRRDLRADDRTASTNLILGANWTPRNRPGTVMEARLRLPVAGEKTATRLTLNMNRETRNGWRAFNEVELTFGEDRIASHSRLGFSYDLNEWLSGQTELSRGAADLDATLNQQLAARWAPSDLLSVTAGIEHSRRMEANEHTLTSVALGAKWESANSRWVGDADLETTYEETGRTHYANLGLAGRVSPDLTVLGRTRLAVDDRNDQDRTRLRVRAGVSYRPVEDPRLEVLGWYERRLEKRAGRNSAHLWSVDATYEVSADLRLNGKYAGQVQGTAIDTGAEVASTTQLIQAGVNYEFGDDRFQFGVNAARLWDDAGNSTGGVGAELGFSPRRNTMLAVGYNHASGRVAGQEELYQDGFYLRLNLLFDNSLWDQLDGFLGN
ncbi:DUF11 domain-containing protein [Pseudooceanicola aestuarii]|uniref:DUF11 domain-containing protein n=1 Tax=Pseudooceanicola aestuarii TaxID=2697319 RepID=UPI0013D5F72B|nr:DUF11 domain-containing protein [Pseudooceanicola aestuarii]